MKRLFLTIIIFSLLSFSAFGENNVSYFAELDENNKVLRVIVVSDADAPDEATGIAFCNKLLGGNWKQTSYTGKIRKNYAGIGYTFNENKNAFIPQKPYKSWVLDEDCRWKAPTLMPDDGNKYIWNEGNKEWTQNIKTIVKEQQ